MASRTMPFLQQAVDSVYDIEEEIGRSVGRLLSEFSVFRVV